MLAAGFDTLGSSWLERRPWQEGKGWRMEVDGRWFREHIGSMERAEDMHLYEERLKEVESAVGHGNVVLEWAASILLATRK